MESLNTQNTTSQNNNHSINSYNSNNLYNNQEEKPTPTKQIQYFSHILEAFIIFINQFNIPTSAYNLLLALLAYAGKRTTFSAAHLILYPFIHNYKNPKSVKPTNIESARKYVWRHLTDTEAWMDQIGITLFTRIVREKQNPTDKYNASEYDITILVNILIEIITEAYATQHLLEFNIGKALQQAAIKKANELKESATPKPVIEKTTAKKQLTPEQQLDKALSLAQSAMLQFKADELAKQSNKQDIADALEAKFLSLFNFFYNIFTPLREEPLREEPPNTTLEPSNNDEICPTYESHVFNYFFSVTEMSHIPDIEEGKEETLFLEDKGDTLPGETTRPHTETGGDVTQMSYGSTGYEEEQIVVDKEVRGAFTVTLFENQFETVGTEANLTLKEFVEEIRINDPVVIAAKSDSDDDVLKAKKKNKGFCPVTFVPEPEGRRDNCVESLSMVCFDYDDADFRKDLNPIVELGYRGFIYTSYRHTDLSHRFRLGFVLKEPIPTKYYRILWDKLLLVLQREVSREGTKINLNIDTTCFNPSRLWYLPAVKAIDSPYYSVVFDSEEHKLLDWRVFIEQEIKDFEANLLNISEKTETIYNATELEPQAVEEKNKKNVSLSSYVGGRYVAGADKPNIPGYHWPSMRRALAEKAGDQSLADASWCFFCALAGIPMDVTILGLLEVSPKASEKANKPYGNGRYYHLDTVREAYEFYARIVKKD